MRRGASGEPNSLAFWYQVRAFSTSAPIPRAPIFASTAGSKVAPIAKAAAALPASAARSIHQPRRDQIAGGDELLALLHEQLDGLGIELAHGA